MQIINAYLSSDTILMNYYEWHMGWSSADIVTGYTFTRYQNSTNLGGGLSGPANLGEADDGDSISWYLNLEPGTYSLTTIYQKGPNSPIIEVFVDSTSLGTFDTYTGVGTPNQVQTTAGITIGSNGNYLLKYLANGKNASSGDYQMLIHAFGIARTGA